MQGEGGGQPLLILTRGECLLGQVGRKPGRVGRGQAQHHQRAPGQAEAVQGLPGPGSAGQGGAEQIGPQPALDVGPGPDP